MFCCQRGETAGQLAKRSDCKDIVTLIAAHKKVHVRDTQFMLCYTATIARNL